MTVKGVLLLSLHRILLSEKKIYLYNKKKFFVAYARLRSCNVPIPLLLTLILSFSDHLSYSVPQHIVRLRSSNVPISLLFIHSLLFQPSSTVAILNSLAIHFCPTFSPYISFTK